MHFSRQFLLFVPSPLINFQFLCSYFSSSAQSSTVGAGWKNWNSLISKQRLKKTPKYGTKPHQHLLFSSINSSFKYFNRKQRLGLKVFSSKIHLKAPCQLCYCHLHTTHILPRHPLTVTHLIPAGHIRSRSHTHTHVHRVLFALTYLHACINTSFE